MQLPALTELYVFVLQFCMSLCVYRWTL